MTGSRCGLVLQECDRQLLRALTLLPVVGPEQAKLVGGFHSMSKANARLLALTRAGLLKDQQAGRQPGRLNRARKRRGGSR